MINNQDDEGWVTMKAIVPDDLQTKWWVMAFGADFLVLLPDFFRDNIKINI